MRKILLLLTLFSSFNAFSQITRISEVVPVIAGSSVTSNAGAAPQSSIRYQRAIYLVAQSELAAAGITNGTAINSLGFLYNAVSEVAVSGNLKIWLQNTSDASNTKSSTTNWTTIAGSQIDGMTLVRDGNATVPNDTYAADFAFTSNFTYTGTNLYIAFEYSNASSPIASALNNVISNNTTTAVGANGLRRSTSNSALPASAATSSSFRPVTRLGYTNNTGTGVTNDAAVISINTLGVYPMSGLNSNNVQAVIKNNGDNTLTNLNVTLNVTGSNTFSNSKQVTIAPGNFAIVNFDGFQPTVAGANTVTVSVPSDAVTANDSKSVSQTTISNVYSYIYGTTATTATSAASTTEHLTKFSTTTTITLSEVRAFFNTPAVGAAYTVVIRSATGSNGLPGPILYESASQNPTGGGAANVVAISPALNITSGNFYVGIKQTGTASIQLLAQAQEDNFPNPLNTFFTTTDGNTYVGVGYGKYIVQPVFSSSLPVTLANLEGKRQGTVNQLSWQTSNEQNNKGFSVERSADGKNFSSIGFVSSKGDRGNSNTTLSYSFNDEKPFSGTNYYRLQQVDNDGKISYSSVVILKGDKAFDISALYPNPAKDQIRLSISSARNQKATITIVDLSGKVLQQIPIGFAEGDNNVTINVSALATGVYYIRFTNAEGEIRTSRFLKN